MHMLSIRPFVPTFQNKSNFKRKPWSPLARLWVWPRGSFMTPVLFTAVVTASIKSFFDKKIFLFFHFSLVVHPNKLLIATGQTTGHDRREGRVSVLYENVLPYIQNLILIHEADPQWPVVITIFSFYTYHPSVRPRPSPLFIISENKTKFKW